MANKCAVIGDSCIDKYIYGVCDRICPEGPVPVVSVQSFTEAPGMAANTHANAKVFWQNEVDLSTNDSDMVRKIRYVDSKTNQLLLRVDVNDTVPRVNHDLHSFHRIFSEYSCIIVSDYCKGFLVDNDIAHIGHSAPLTVLDTKRKLTREMIEGYTFVKLNQQEFENNADIVDKNTIKKFIITKGSEGVMWNEKEFPPPVVLQTFDVSGAGDVFTAAFTYSIQYSNTVEKSISYAQECCNKVIRKRGTCVYENSCMD